MTWKTMGAERGCDLVEFWIGAAWPLTRPEMLSLATAELGWTVDEKGGLYNVVDGLSQPGVITGITRGDVMGTINWWVTDVVRDQSEAGDAFLGDEFTLLVREASRRWGKAKIKRGLAETAQWKATGGGRIVARRSKSSVVVEFATPQQVVEYEKRGE